MKNYEFTLKFQLADPQADLDQYADLLYGGGCDDALIGIGRKGKIALQFTRAAESANGAMFSAITHVRAAIPDAKLIEAAPDFVGISEVAQVLNCSRQNMRVLIDRGVDVPLAVHEGSSSLWHLADLLTWLQDTKAYVIEPELFEVAQITKLINSARNLSEIQKISSAHLNTLIEMVA